MSSHGRHRVSAALLFVSMAGGSALLAWMGACSQSSGTPELVASHSPPGQSTTGPVTDSGTTTTSVPGSDAGRSVTVLATGVNSPQALALDSTSVYWTTSKSSVSFGTTGDAAAGTGAVEKVGRSGGPVTGIIAGLGAPASLAITGISVFFSTSDGTKGTVIGYVQGSTEETQYGVEESLPIPMVTNAGILYWAGSTGSRLDVQSVSAAGGGITAVASVAQSSIPQTMVTDGTSLYILSTGTNGASTIQQTAISGGATKQVWQGTGVPATQPGLALDGQSLYWTVTTSAGTGGQILTTSTSGGAVSTIASNLEAPAQLAYDSGTLYFTSAIAGGTVLSVSVGGGAITTLATGLDYPTALVVDDAVYVGTQTTITRVPR